MNWSDLIASDSPRRPYNPHVSLQSLADLPLICSLKECNCTLRKQVWAFFAYFEANLFPWLHQLYNCTVSIYCYGVCSLHSWSQWFVVTLILRGLSLTKVLSWILHFIWLVWFSIVTSTVHMYIPLFFVSASLFFFLFQVSCMLLVACWSAHICLFVPSPNTTLVHLTYCDVMFELKFIRLCVYF